MNEGKRGDIPVKLVIGGSFQGKLDFVRRRLLDEGILLPDQPMDELTAYGEFCTKQDLLGKPVIDGYHQVIRRVLANGENPVDLTEKIILKNPDVWLIMDQVGSGIVPVDAFERQWRECVGRIGCDLAARADEVYRLLCGIPRCLKKMPESEGTEREKEGKGEEKGCL